ncbi:MAG: hypothetical protein IJU29_09830 [Oscillospiraceae bacterium]|nr:hypothetical protein [Oscillospiraceae bacterium]
MSDFMADLGSVLMDTTVQNLQTATASKSTNAKAGKDLEMNDFLSLMVAMFQNQSIDDTASTSDMMNQMMQMSVISAVTNMQNTLTQSTNLSYAASLVGKEVTIGQYEGSKLKEITGTVTGTGTLDGKQIIFVGDESYWLSDVMAVGRLPEAPLKEAMYVGDGEEEPDALLQDNGADNLLLRNGMGRNTNPSAEDEYESTNGLSASARTVPDTGAVPSEVREQAAEEIYESSF